MPAIDARLAKYDTKDLAKIKALQDAGITLTLEETSDELDAIKAANAPSDEVEAAQEDEDLTNKMAPRFQEVVISGQKKRFAIHFVHSVNGKTALYNENGVRISPVYKQDDILPGSEGSSPTNAVKYISKAAVKNNAQRRNSMMAEDYFPVV